VDLVEGLMTTPGYFLEYRNRLRKLWVYGGVAVVLALLSGCCTHAQLRRHEEAARALGRTEGQNECMKFWWSLEENGYFEK
jgi:hypothetical protein